MERPALKRPLLKLDILSYRARAHDLSTLEQGAYLLLLMHYWQHGGLPIDDDKLARIAGATSQEWPFIRNRLFMLFGPGWRDKDIEQARAAEVDRSARAARAGSLSWVGRPRQAKAVAKAEALADITAKPPAKPADVVAPPTFEQFWAAYDSEEGSRDRAWEAFDLLSDADKAAAFDALPQTLAVGLSADQYLRERWFDVGVRQ